MASIRFDRRKSARNLQERGLSFEAVERFEWETCIIDVSRAQEPTATRFMALGALDGRLVSLVFTIDADGIRVISLRAASRKERSRYDGQA